MSSDFETFLANQVGYFIITSQETEHEEDQ